MAKVSVLIVDNDPQLRGLLARGLSRQPGFTVIAHTGDPIVAAHQAWFWQPDIILLDIKRADGVSLESYQCIARASPGSHLVFYTSYLQEGDEELCRKLGSCTCLVKSIGLAALVRRLRSLLEAA